MIIAFALALAVPLATGARTHRALRLIAEQGLAQCQLTPAFSSITTMDTKMVSQSVDEATKALKSRMTEGSSKLFGSMQNAKRGLLGGITSTFDHVVNIVGDKTASTANTTSASGKHFTSQSQYENFRIMNKGTQSAK